MTPEEQNTQDRTPVLSEESEGSHFSEHQETSAIPVPLGHAQSSCKGAEVPLAPMSPIPTEGEVLRLIATNYLQTTPPKSKADRNDFLAYLQQMRVAITGVGMGSLLITITCDSLEILERLWQDYSSGHLGEVVQRCFVTEEILTELSLAELKLQTTITEEEYLECKMYFEKHLAQDQCEIVAEPVEVPSLFSDEEILAEKDDDDEDNEDDDEDDGDYYLTETGGTADEDFSRIKTKGEKRSFDSAKVSIEQVPAHRSIVVSGISDTTTHDAIELYFESRRRGGGPVERVKFIPKSGRAVVAFEDSKGHVPCRESSGDDINYKAKSGYVLVINNYIFPGKDDVVRTGSIDDVWKLIRLFDDFSFRQRVLDNQSGSQMLELLRGTAKKDFSRYDCFVCVILSHGTEDGIYGTDEKGIKIEAITSLFRRSECPSLEGKPKIFLIQACRGPLTSSSLPADADFLICLAPGHQSYRKALLGSWFISSVVDVFKEYAEREHLVDMMLRVNNRVAGFFSKKGLQKQMLCQVCMLRKKVFFDPKYSS